MLFVVSYFYSGLYLFMEINIAKVLSHYFQFLVCWNRLILKREEVKPFILSIIIILVITHTLYPY
jgi:hypothetical protein